MKASRACWVSVVIVGTFRDPRPGPAPWPPTGPRSAGRAGGPGCGRRRTSCARGVSDAPGDELLAGLGLTVAIDLVLVDVARGHEVVADLELGVRALSGLGVGDEVVEGRVQLREAAVGLLAVVLDADAGVEAGRAVAREVDLWGGGDEPVQAHLSGNRHPDS